MVRLNFLQDNHVVQRFLVAGIRVFGRSPWRDGSYKGVAGRDFSHVPPVFLSLGRGELKPRRIGGWRRLTGYRRWAFQPLCASLPAGD